MTVLLTESPLKYIKPLIKPPPSPIEVAKNATQVGEGLSRIRNMDDLKANARRDPVLLTLRHVAENDNPSHAALYYGGERAQNLSRNPAVHSASRIGVYQLSQVPQVKGSQSVYAAARIIDDQSNLHLLEHEEEREKNEGKYQRITSTTQWYNESMRSTNEQTISQKHSQRLMNQRRKKSKESTSMGGEKLKAGAGMPSSQAENLLEPPDSPGGGSPEMLAS